MRLPRMIPIARSIRSGVIALAIAAAACEPSLGIGTGGPGDPDPVDEIPDSLAQFVTVTPSDPAGGDDIVVVSVLRNNATTPRDLTVRVCGLNWGGNLRLSITPGLPPCSGHTTTTTVAPGDSLVQSASWRILSGPGNYILNVGHLSEPNYLHPIPVVVH